MRRGIHKKGNNYCAVVYDGIDAEPDASGAAGSRPGLGERTLSGCWRT